MPVPSCFVVKNGTKISSWLSWLIGRPSLVTLMTVCSDGVSWAVMTTFPKREKDYQAWKKKVSRDFTPDELVSDIMSRIPNEEEEN